MEPVAGVMYVHLVLLRVRVLTTGEWCAACALPSAFTAEMLVTTDPQTGPPWYYLHRSCTNCSEDDE